MCLWHVSEENQHYNGYRKITDLILKDSVAK